MGHHSVSDSALCGLADCLLTNLLQFLVLLGRKNRLHLRIGLLMNSPELLHFLYFRKRIIGLDGVHFWYFGGKNGQDFLLLLRREVKLLCYRLSLLHRGSLLSKRTGCQERKHRDG